MTGRVMVDDAGRPERFAPVSPARRHTPPSSPRTAPKPDRRILEVERDFLAAVLESSAGATVVLDGLGRVLRFNPACGDLFTQHFPEAVGQPVWDLMPTAAERLAMRSGVRSIQPGQPPVEFPTDAAGPQPPPRHVLWRGTAMTGVDGGVEYLILSGIDMTAQYLAVEQLEHRLRMEELLAAVSSRLAGRLGDSPEAAVQAALALAGTFTGSDRCYYFRFDEANARMGCWQEWCAPGVEPQIEAQRDLPLSRFPYLSTRMRQGEVVNLAGLEDLPPWAGLERVEYQRQGICSLLCVPVRADRRTVGMLGFDAVRRPRRWGADDIRLLGLLGELIHTARERHEADRAREDLIRTLRQAAVRIRALSDLIPICCACKKVRDDQGYWRQVEDYLREHATLEFSHGICPDCVTRLYPAD